MTAVRGAALAACALTLCACGASAHKSAAKVVARKAAMGRHASVTASYDFSVLEDLSVHVEATPAQRIKGGWVVSCRGEGTSRDSADFAGRVPLDVAVPFTMPTPTQSTCEFVAVATLSRSGRVRVELRGRHSF